MKSTNYIVIQGWMCNELGLKGNELLVFALIYGFSQDGKSKFSGGRKYIGETFDISLPTVDKILQNLVTRNFITKESSNDYKHTDSYFVTDWVNDGVVKKLYQGSKETLPGGSKETLPYNTNNKNINNKSNSKELLQFDFGKQKIKKDSLYSKCVNLVNEYTTDTDLHEALISYLRVRLEIKDKPLYANSWKGLLNKLDREFDASERLKVVRQSIERGYLSFYPVNNGNTVLRTESGVRHVPRMTQEDYEKEAEHLAELESKGVQVRF